MQIDISGRSSCLLSLTPEDCVNGGATYMFWMKPTDDLGGPILTTVKDASTGGFYVWVDGAGYLYYSITYVYLSPSIYRGHISGFKKYTNSWVHLAFVKYNSETAITLYINGTRAALIVSPHRTDFYSRIPTDLRTIVLGQMCVYGLGPTDPRPPKQNDCR